MLPLAKREKILLLGLARETIARQVWENSFELRRIDEEALQVKAGAFVTLHSGEALRGCIGRIRTPDPLYATIQEMAVAAAFQDPRFPPLSRDEFGSLAIEISVLSPPEIIAAEDVVVGEHGLIVSSGYKTGLLLPQVPVEWEWDRETFLSHTCLKADLPENAWRSGGVKIEAFTAQVFSESSEKGE